MNYKDAIEALDFNSISGLTLEALGQRYRKMALKHHPDKNGNTAESNERFKRINEAYNYLKNVIAGGSEEAFQEDDEETGSDYVNVLNSFMKGIFKGDYLTKIVDHILTKGKELTLGFFDDLDKDSALDIYIFLSKYRTVLHLSTELLDRVRETVVQKFDSVQLFKLNPSISDLFNNNIYKLWVNGELFLVPLWHQESHFDGSGCEIIVMCDPELPSNITIDDDNNIIVDITIIIHDELLDMIFNNKTIKIPIGNKVFEIDPSRLYIKKEQIYRFCREGISKIKNSIYDVDDKADIVVKIHFSSRT